MKSKKWNKVLSKGFGESLMNNIGYIKDAQAYVRGERQTGSGVYSAEN